MPRAATTKPVTQALPWWEYRAMRQRLSAWASTLDGNQRYTLQLAPNTGVAYTDFARRRYVVDPLMVGDGDGDPALHLAVVKGLIAHEAGGHGHWTDPLPGVDANNFSATSQVLHQIWNGLEDERVERACMNHYWGSERYIRLIRRLLWDKSPELEGTDSPWEVIQAALLIRFGGKIKGTLSATNQQLFTQAWPLIVAAWNAPSSAVCRDYAEQLMKLLKIDELAEEQAKKMAEALKNMPSTRCGRSMSGRRDGAAPRSSGQGQAGEAGDKCPECGGQMAGQAGDEQGGQPGAGMPGQGAGAESGQGQGAGQGAGQGQGQGDGQGEGQGDQPGQGQGAGAGQGQGAGAGQGQGQGDGTCGTCGGHKHGEQGEGDGEADGALDDDEMRELIEEARRELEAVYGQGAGGPRDADCPLKPRAITDDLYASASGRAQVLRRQLERIPPMPRTRPAENGHRYSFRDELRRPDTPMRRRDVPTRKRRVAIGILVDCSGSMGGVMQQVREAVLATWLAADALKVPASVCAFSDWSRNPAATIVPFGTSATVAGELINGLSATGGTVLAPALEQMRSAIREVPAERRVLLVVHDGQPYDAEASAAIIKQMSNEAEVVGVFLGDESIYGGQVDEMRNLFGRRLVVAEDAEALMVVLGTFLARLFHQSAI